MVPNPRKPGGRPKRVPDALRQTPFRLPFTQPPTGDEERGTVIPQTPATVDRYEVGDLERDGFAASAAAVTADPYRDFETFLRQARAAIQLPAGLAESLTTFGERRAAGALLVRNLPLPAHLPPTPGASFISGPRTPLGTEPVIAACILAIGEPFTFAQWDGGILVHNKYPIRAHRDIQFGSNAVEFLLHTETPFRQPSPDFLGLLCLRADPTGVAKTAVSAIDRVIASLPPAVQEVLRTPSFAFETDNPAVHLNGRGLTVPHPILTTRDGRDVVEYVGDLVATTPAAGQALDLLRDQVSAAAVHVPLEAGDLLLLDNSRVVHGRNSFTPRYDGTDRWLQRMLITTTLFERGEVPSSRLVEDRKYANYPTDYQRVLTT